MYIDKEKIILNFIEKYKGITIGQCMNLLSEKTSIERTYGNSEGTVTYDAARMMLTRLRTPTPMRKRTLTKYTLAGTNISIYTFKGLENRVSYEEKIILDLYTRIIPLKRKKAELIDVPFQENKRFQYMDAVLIYRDGDKEKVIYIKVDTSKSAFHGFDSNFYMDTELCSAPEADQSLIYISNIYEEAELQEVGKIKVLCIRHTLADFERYYELCF